MRMIDKNDEDEDRVDYYIKLRYDLRRVEDR
jgi:hypothetical protein